MVSDDEKLLPQQLPRDDNGLGSFRFPWQASPQPSQQQWPLEDEEVSRIRHAATDPSRLSYSSYDFGSTRSSTSDVGSAEQGRFYREYNLNFGRRRSSISDIAPAEQRPFRTSHGFGSTRSSTSDVGPTEQRLFQSSHGFGSTRSSISDGAPAEQGLSHPEYNFGTRRSSISDVPPARRGLFHPEFDFGRRRSSLPVITAPQEAVTTENGRVSPRRRRSNSLPMIASTPPSPTFARPEKRKVIFTMSPYRRDTRFHRPGEQLLATFKGERLVEEPEEEFEPLERSETRASVRSLEKWHHLKKRRSQKVRSKLAQRIFQYSVYLFLICFVYFVLIGRPIWGGGVYYIWYVMKYVYTIQAGCAIFVSIGFFYAAGSLLVHYEPDPAPIPPEEFQAHIEKASSTALIIPCYKSAGAIEATIKAALKTFPPENIYVVANGNSPTPLDETEDVIRPYKVNHIWVPVGSKIVAQFVGAYAAYKFQYVLMIDDDCLLPAAFPIVSDRIQPGNKRGAIKCVGYTIKATGPNGSKGTIVQQLQDLEYKLSGMQRTFAGKWGSATFAHGAIALWDRDFVLKCFRHHPGFKISEDWFFGLTSRNLGGRIVMCSSVLVETEVPSGLFVGAGSRGGFGEMTVYKQRFFRWNFFFLFRQWHDWQHILFKWKLGVYSVGSKVYTFQESYETILYITGPILLSVAFAIEPAFMGMMTGVVMGMYFVIVNIFNEVTLRRKGEMVSRKVVVFYYLPYKFVLRLMNTASVYYSMYKYAQYFATRHPSIIEDDQAVELVVCSKRRPSPMPAVPEEGRPSFLRRLSSFGRSKSVDRKKSHA